MAAGSIHELRQRTLRAIGATLGVAAGVALVAAVLTTAAHWSNDARIFLTFLPFGIGFLLALGHRKRFVREYKTTVFTAATRQHFPTLTYQPFQGFSSEQFRATGLFDDTPNLYSSEDFFVGTTDGIPIAFSEVNARRESGSGKNRHVRTIFKGTLFGAEFNKNVPGYVLLIPDAEDLAHKLLAMIGLGGKLERCKLESPNFERFFNCYTTDQVLARYVLSPAFMEHLLALVSRWGGARIRVCFARGKIMIAVPHFQDLYEPTLLSSRSDAQTVAGFVRDVRHFTGVVEALKLTDYLWGKDGPSTARRSG